MVGLARDGIGDWRLIRCIGEGAFGAVYEAERQSGGGQRAAVKVLHPHIAVHPDIQRRFVNEARAAARAEHENIVRIFDSGISDGTCYVAMELLAGQTLRSILQSSGPLGLFRTLDLGAQIADGLAAAHAIGVVHRDLKPDNLFVMRRDAGEHVKVLDFGIAKLRNEGDHETRSGTLLGTPAYMAPDQWLSLPDLDGRSDIYALGSILFECLTGRLPLDAETSHGWMHAHLSEPPLDGELFGVRPAVASLIRWMLAKRRESRIGSMPHVAAELRALRHILEDAAPRPSTGVVARCVPAAMILTPLSGRFHISARHSILSPLRNGQAIAGLGIAVLG